jgi:hypothetical protein
MWGLTLNAHLNISLSSQGRLATHDSKIMQEKVHITPQIRFEHWSEDDQ